EEDAEEQERHAEPGNVLVEGVEAERGAGDARLGDLEPARQAGRGRLRECRQLDLWERRELGGGDGWGGRAGGGKKPARERVGIGGELRERGRHAGRFGGRGYAVREAAGLLPDRGEPRLEGRASRLEIGEEGAQRSDLVGEQGT